MFTPMLGGLAHLPIREETADLRLPQYPGDKMVTQQELERRTARSAEDQARADPNVKTFAMQRYRGRSSVACLRRTINGSPITSAIWTI